MKPKPTHLGPEYGAQFEDASIAAAYRARPPPKEFGFYKIDSEQLTWKPMKAAEPAEDWSNAHGLFLGQSAFGDPFWWTQGHRSAPDGNIFLLDHDGGLGGDVMFVHFARSFSEFLAKVAHFKNLYSTPQDELFHREYVELNPLARI